MAYTKQIFVKSSDQAKSRVPAVSKNIAGIRMGLDEIFQDRLFCKGDFK